MYVPRERRATPFRGDGSDLTDAEEWASDITRFATAWGMTGLDGAEHALANLEGLARREILSLPASDIISAQEICDAIVTAFGERRSAAQLRDALHARRQATTGTICEFGHSLFRNLERLQSKLHNTPAMLVYRARFVDGLRNKSIRKSIAPPPYVHFWQMRIARTMISRLFATKLYNLSGKKNKTKMTPRGNTSQAVSNHPSQIYNNKSLRLWRPSHSCRLTWQ